MLSLLGCGDGGEQPVAPDHTPPAAIDNLTAGNPGSNSVLLSWTVPGDDGTVGTAAQYDLRYSTAGEISAATWEVATQATGEPPPGAPGTLQSFTVNGLDPLSTYWFALKTADEIPNWSPVSSAARATTLAGFSDGFIRVASGQFILGSPPGEPGRDEDELLHLVTFTRPFFISDHEVTQAEWRALMGWNDSDFLAENRPVEQVTWFDCVDFCNRKSQAAGFGVAYTITNPQTSGNHIISATVAWDRNATGYRLPTEAEWEYACRATSLPAFCNGEISELGCGVDSSLTRVGWYCGNAGAATHAVKGKQPNSWNLYDMHGNVWEWCWDWYAPYASAGVSDPAGGASGSARILRGGAWNYDATYCRSAYRRSDASPGYYYHDIGVRLVRLAS